MRELALYKRRVANAALDAAVFTAAAFGMYLAQTLDRPVTAVLIFLAGVILVAVHSGLASALIAALAASVTYSFLIAETAGDLDAATADHFVPLIAFNLTAVFAGVLVGRIKNAATKAEAARAETAFLLSISDRLQGAFDVKDIESEVGRVLPAHGLKTIEIYLVDGERCVRPSTGEGVAHNSFPRIDTDTLASEVVADIFLTLEGARGPLGTARFVFAQQDDKQLPQTTLRSINALLGLAVERCLLLSRVAEAQANAQSEVLKDAIFASVSHDLRTPLTAMEAAASALASETISIGESDRRALLASILEQCRRLDRYTSDLLDVGRIQAGLDGLRIETLEACEIVQAASAHAGKIHPAACIRHDLPDAPVFVRANATMFEQALFNIIDNACKFGGTSGDIEISLTTKTDRVVIDVADSGPGVSEEDRQRLFDRFYRSERTHSRGGSGLGLFIAKGFVEGFGGQLEVRNREDGNGGARFALTVQLAPRLPDLELET